MTQHGQTEEETADAALFYEHKQLETWSTDAAVEAVEGRVEVETWPQAVHLQKHLSEEQSEEQKLCIVWNHRNKDFET